MQTLINRWWCSVKYDINQPSSISSFLNTSVKKKEKRPMTSKENKRTLEWKSMSHLAILCFRAFEKKALCYNLNPIYPLMTLVAEARALQSFTKSSG